MKYILKHRLEENYTDPSGCHSLAVRSREADKIQYSFVVATHRTSRECPHNTALSLYSGTAIGTWKYFQKCT